ncbi:organic cation transporter protein [Halyomorpha halys]|uniref:organic cation transporter protein n=1 Tax=Halyomorpha halys TaxID=286706 RepID=UPI0006D52259|nr:organic cation transporter protein-like [Halyomorpha halys]
MDLDNILTELGEFGKYQIGVYVLLFFPLIFGALGSLTYVFTAGDIDYRCKVPECETDITSYDNPWLSNALPFKDGKVENHCLRYKSSNTTYHQNCSKDIFIKGQIEECHSFVFKNNEMTIIKEFNLLCDENEWKRTTVGTLHNIGEFIGMPLAGLFSDRFGRKTMITTAALCSSILGTLRSFSFNYLQFVALEIADAIALSGIYAGIFVLGIEFTGPSKRAFGGALLSCYYSVGEMILGLIVWLEDDWRTYLRIIYLPGLILVLYFWMLPESVRWLIAHGQTEKAKQTFEKLSSVNNKSMNDNVKKAIDQIQISEQKHAEDSENAINNKFHDSKPDIKIYKSKTMILRILNCSFCWATNAFVYYGLSLYSVVIGGNKYFNFVLVSFIEIPGYSLSPFIINKFGRIIPLATALILSGLACIMFHFLPTDYRTLSLVLFLFGKCSITVSFASLYVSASEYFPTSARHSLMAFCSMIGRVGSIVAPQMPLLSAYIDPLLIFGGTAVVAGGLAFYFPETLNCKLPDTIEEAENIGKKSHVERH